MDGTGAGAGRTRRAAADVFAWGLLVAFAGTGRPPFGTGRPDAVVYRIVHEAPDVGGIDHALVPIVLAALEKDPHRRPRPEPILHELLARDGAASTQVAPGHVLPTAPAQPPPAPPLPPVHAAELPLPHEPARRSGARRALAVLGVLALLAAAGAGGVWLARLGDDTPAAADPDLSSTVPTGAVETTPSTSPRTAPTTAPPTTRPVAGGDVESYCDAAHDYYSTLDEYQGGLGLFPDEDERDDAFLEFAAENQDLGEELRANAPADIAADVAIVVDAFELAGEGDLSGYDTDEYTAARDALQGFELIRCRILRFD